MFLLGTRETVLVLVFVVTTMLSIGMQTRTVDLLTLGASRGFLGRVLLANFVVVPLVGVAIALLIPMQRPVAGAIVLLACTPGGLSAVQFTSQVKGGAAVAGAVLGLLSLLAVFVSPLLLKLVLPGQVQLAIPYGGVLFSFLLFLNLLFAPVQQLVQLYTTYQQGQSSVSKLAELLERRPSVVEAAGATDLPPIEGRIELDSVDFDYGEGVGEESATVLEGLDLAVEAGETLVVVGPTGAGKSTVAKLVARFYDPTSGRVCIDGTDLRSVTIESLRRQLGVVPQEPFLFHGTIRDNLVFARPDAGDEEPTRY